jgi:hypothetical protein
LKKTDLKKCIRQDEERLEKKRRGEVLEGEEEAVITALDMEDAWKKEVGLLLQLVSCRDIQRLRTTPLLCSLATVILWTVFCDLSSLLIFLIFLASKSL